MSVEITPTYGGDNLMMIESGNESCANLNDAVHAAPLSAQEQVLADLKERYGTIDYVFCGYGIASHFPNCYVVPGKNDEETARRRQAHFDGVWASIVARLKPKMAFPFAADVAIVEDELAWANEPVHNGQRPTDAYLKAHPDGATQVYDIAPGFVVENGKVLSEKLFRPFSLEEFRTGRPDDVRIANTVTSPSAEEVEALAERVRENVALCAQRLGEYSGDYAFLIELKRAETAIAIRKKNRDISVEIVPSDAPRGRHDIVFTTRLSYLRRALNTPYGYEVIFVGSGGVFTYRDRSSADANLHLELTPLLRKLDRPYPSRYGDQPRWLYALKTGIKSLLGRSAVASDDLYDLKNWIVYRND